MLAAAGKQCVEETELHLFGREADDVGLVHREFVAVGCHLLHVDVVEIEFAVEQFPLSEAYALGVDARETAGRLKLQSAVPLHVVEPLSLEFGDVDADGHPAVLGVGEDGQLVARDESSLYLSVGLSLSKGIGPGLFEVVVGLNQQAVAVNFEERDELGIVGRFVKLLHHWVYLRLLASAAGAEDKKCERE